MNFYESQLSIRELEQEREEQELREYGTAAWYRKWALPIPGVDDENHEERKKKDES